MEVTITIPDEFAERLIPAGKDVSRLLMERLVDRACDDGRIGSEEANELLGRTAKVDPNGSLSERESLQPQALYTRWAFRCSPPKPS
jgi:hypothetical protein